VRAFNSFGTPFAFKSRHIDRKNYNYMKDKVLNRKETVAKIFKLIDVCKRCVRAFDAAAQFAANTEVRDLTTKISQTVAGYQLELQREVRRIEAEDLENALANAAQSNFDGAHPKDRRDLEVVLNEYRSVLRTQLPPHARAMVRRQCRAIDSFYKQWSRLGQPA
jgi:hypothetical protein